jgi:hypothetical protein
MKCSHVICEACSGLTKDLSCPIHEEKFTPIGIQQFTFHIFLLFSWFTVDVDLSNDIFTFDTLICQILQIDSLVIHALVSYPWTEEVFVELCWFEFLNKLKRSLVIRSNFNLLSQKHFFLYCIESNIWSSFSMTFFKSICFKSNHLFSLLCVCEISLDIITFICYMILISFEI